MTTTTFDHHRARGATRVLLAVHGGEPSTWAADVARTVSLWGTPALRILAVVTVPHPPFAGLLPSAARRYHGARAAWQRLEEQRLQPLIDRLLTHWPQADVAWASAQKSDPGRTIAEHAETWGADAILVGAAPPAGPWLGTVHERLIRHAPCPVLVVPVAPAPRRRARVLTPVLGLGRVRRLRAGLGV
jgi:nucleotide-binding universal stress UspA family protein